VGPEDDVLLLELLRRILHGTLDTYSREDVSAKGVDQTAKLDLEYLRSFPAPREWWRVGRDRSGAPVGVVFPTRNYEHAIIAYLGVVPEQRGNGYAQDLLLEATRTLAALGATEVHADTDVGNIPMVSAFRAAGYRFAVHIVLA
jgi:RimJ/RimL family protein N-acetyltransferase